MGVGRFLKQIAVVGLVILTRVDFKQTRRGLWALIECLFEKVRSKPSLLHPSKKTQK